MTNLSTLPAFVDDRTFHVVVESPRGAALKLKYDPHLGVMSVSRPLSLGLVFPYDWGFIPSTRGMDDDPVDAVVLWDVASAPGVVIPCRALGIVRVEQNRLPHRRGDRIRNDRILALPKAARRPAPDHLSERIRDELANFFIASTAPEGKDVTILAWDGPEAALAEITRSLEGTS